MCRGTPDELAIDCFGDMTIVLSGECETDPAFGFLLDDGGGSRCLPATVTGFKQKPGGGKGGVDAATELNDILKIPEQGSTDLVWKEPRNNLSQMQVEDRYFKVVSNVH